MGAASGTMRWRYTRGASEIEARARLRVENNMQRFWSAFIECADDLEKLFEDHGAFDLPRFMADHLEPIDHRLMWEFGPAEIGHRLVITPEATRHLRPMVSRLLTMAPPLPGWTFLPYRPPELLEDAHRLVEARTGKPLRLDEVEIKRGEHSRIDLAFVPERGARPSRELEEQAFVAAEALAGERFLDDWIGAIELVPESERAVPLERLHERVASSIRDVQAALPDRPYFAAREELSWSVYQVGEPEEREDAGGRQDVYVGRTAAPTLFTTAQAGVPFSSSRFSRCGELFCYLKLAGDEIEPGSELRDRVTIEEQVDRALLEAELGTVIGGASGRAFTYVDLALAKPEQGFDRAQEVLRDLGAPRRSWILFFDDDLSGEWVPIWEDSPRPPGLPA